MTPLEAACREPDQSERATQQADADPSGSKPTCCVVHLR